MISHNFRVLTLFEEFQSGIESQVYQKVLRIERGMDGPKDERRQEEIVDSIRVIQQRMISFF